MKNLWKRIKNLAKRCWTKFEELCILISKKTLEAAKWCCDHPEVVSVLGTAVGAVNWAWKKFHKTSTERELEYQRKHIYDYSIGAHWTLKREPTSDEMFEIERRKANGEKYGDILRSMRILA